MACWVCQRALAPCPDSHTLPSPPPPPPPCRRAGRVCRRNRVHLWIHRSAGDDVAGIGALPLWPPRPVEQAVHHDAWGGVQGHAVGAACRLWAPGGWWESFRQGSLRAAWAGSMHQLSWLATRQGPCLLSLTPLVPDARHARPPSPPAPLPLPAARSTSARTCLPGTTRFSAAATLSLKNTSAWARGETWALIPSTPLNPRWGSLGRGGKGGGMATAGQVAQGSRRSGVPCLLHPVRQVVLPSC